ncbi:MAG: hypothetical protein B9S34_16280 [Opitutia bacterium Tous-C1TDCM]|nr:MAG: hypothetical protein B9S34_16280 [Opitutae bacterium Tous-C1TDCM]
MRRAVSLPLLVLCCAAGAVPGRGGETAAAAAPATAERYVAEALAANPGLAAQGLEAEAAQARVAELRGAWQPRVDLLARYSRADGGRTIGFPAGDLLNGAYGVLNDFLRTQGRPAAFAPLSNQTVALLRREEQETKLRLTQPIYRPELGRGIAAQRAAAGARATGYAAQRRDLRRAVLSGYYGYLQAEAAVGILESARDLAGEARRVNAALAAAGKITADRVLRAEADELEVVQQLAGAQRDRNAARAALNVLRHRPLAEPLERVPEPELLALAEAWLARPPAAEGGGRVREEETARRQAVEAAAAAEDAVRARGRPTLALAVEGGLQGERYRTGSGDRFVQGSLVAEFNLWDGRVRRSQAQQARLERRRAEAALEETRQQLALEAQVAADDLTAAAAGFRAARRRAEAAAEAYELVQRREREGLANQLSLLDGRDALTRAQLGRAAALYRILTAAAAVERTAAPPPGN